MDMLTADEEDTSMKDPVFLCNIISTLIKHLNSEGAQVRISVQHLSYVAKSALKHPPFFLVYLHTLNSHMKWHKLV